MGWKLHIVGIEGGTSLTEMLMSLYSTILRFHNKTEKMIFRNVDREIKQRQYEQERWIKVKFPAAPISDEL